MSKETNPCIESGCRGACCRNVLLALSDEEWDRFQNNLPKDSVTENSELTQEGLLSDWLGLPNRTITSITHSQAGDKHIVQLEGACPKLGEDYNCTIYESRPICCAEKVQIGDNQCRDARAFYAISNENFGF